MKQGALGSPWASQARTALAVTIAAAALVGACGTAPRFTRDLPASGDPFSPVANLRSDLGAALRWRAALATCHAVGPCRPQSIAEQLLTNSAEIARLFEPSLGASQANRLESHLAREAADIDDDNGWGARGAGDLAEFLWLSTGVRREVIAGILSHQRALLSEVRAGSVDITGAATSVLGLGSDLADVLVLALQRRFPERYQDFPETPAASARSRLELNMDRGSYLAALGISIDNGPYLAAFELLRRMTIGDGGLGALDHAAGVWHVATESAGRLYAELGTARAGAALEGLWNLGGKARRDCVKAALS